MTFHATSPHIKSSCYNCRHFQINKDMLNGTCHLHQQQKSAIGTCGSFQRKVETRKFNAIFE